MDEKIVQCGQYYRMVVDYFINQYKLKASLISYQDYLVGCSLFNLGINLDYEQSVSVLGDFLQNVNVQTKENSKEPQNVSDIKDQLQVEMEERRSSR